VFDTEEIEHAPLNLATARATGVTAGTAHTIPALLLPGEITGFTLDRLGELRRLPDAVLDGVICYRIVGEHRGQAITLWVNRRTFLLLRIDEPDSVTHYDEPVLNGEVTEEMLRPGW
jgi:hypothetical protein